MRIHVAVWEHEGDLLTPASIDGRAIRTTAEALGTARVLREAADELEQQAEDGRFEDET